MEHTHPDDGRLRFACQACGEIVAADQRAAEVAEAPRRNVIVEFTAVGREYWIDTILHWPNWDRRDVRDFYTRPALDDRIAAEIDIQLTRQVSSGSLLDEALADIRVTNMIPGKLVDEPASPDPMEGQPTLFD